MFDKALNDEELSAVRTYLHTKWFTPFDGTTVPSDVRLENGARLDFGGGSWAFDTVKGAGTIGDADVTIAGSVEPGLAVEGVVTFAEGAGVDLSRIAEKPAPGDIVLVTCRGVEGEPVVKNWRFDNMLFRLRTIDNGDGTVSLVGNVKSRGFSVFLR